MLRKRRQNAPSLVLGARGRGLGCHIHAFTTPQIARFCRCRFLRDRIGEVTVSTWLF